MKKIIQLFIGIILITFLNGCSFSTSPAPDTMMDELNEEGLFVYKNQDLNFQLAFPETFKYYQVQRKNTDEYIEIEFFIPTSDIAYPQEVSGYAKPVVVRFYTNAVWNQFDKKDYVESIFLETASNETGRFFIKFWKTRPKDWEGKWNQATEDQIKTSFKSL